MPANGYLFAEWEGTTGPTNGHLFAEWEGTTGPSSGHLERRCPCAITARHARHEARGSVVPDLTRDMKRDDPHGVPHTCALREAQTFE
jgi:hypothetical protein